MTNFFSQIKNLAISNHLDKILKNEKTAINGVWKSCKVLSRTPYHGYGESDNHTQETDAQVNTRDALQEIAYAAMEDKGTMANLASIKLTLSQILTQSQETILVLFKQLQALQVQTNTNKPVTEKPAAYKKTKGAKLKCCCCNHGRTRILDC